MLLKTTHWFVYFTEVNYIFIHRSYFIILIVIIFLLAWVLAFSKKSEIKGTLMFLYIKRTTLYLIICCSTFPWLRNSIAKSNKLKSLYVWWSGRIMHKYILTIIKQIPTVNRKTFQSSAPHSWMQGYGN